jgi:hypothetical protein
VFAFVCNPFNDPQWNPKVVKVEKLTLGPIGVGTAFRQTVEFAGGHAESEWQITDYQPNYLFHSRGTRGLDFDGGYRFESKRKITRVTKCATFDLSKILPLFASASAAGLLVSGEFEASFDRLKKLLEQQMRGARRKFLGAGQLECSNNVGTPDEN